jgi:hypothetical protein
MVGHLVHVDRATPLVLTNVPMGRLDPWLDSTTQLTFCTISVLVLVSAVARNKTSTDNTNKSGMSNLGGVGRNLRNSRD